MNKLSFFSFALVISLQTAPHAMAEEIVIPPLLVITDLRTVGDESSSAEANAFSDFLRKEIERTGAYRIISRSSILAILKANSFTYPCYEIPCFTAMGKLLGADEIVAGNLKRR
ncbi:MAG: hypothetical protein ACP5I1_14530, partial [Candidatus Hinthialibacter sp.]